MKKIVILAFIIISILIEACLPTRSFYSCVNPTHNPLSNSYFKLLWSRSGIALDPSSFNASLQGIDSTAFAVIGQDPEYGNSKMLAFDTQSGNVLWQRNAIQQIDSTTNSSQLFIGLYDKIEIVDPKTGNLIRTIEFDRVGTIYNLFISENNLYAFTKSGSWLTYSIEDGTYNLSSPPYDLFHVENGTIYIIEGTKFKAKDSETQSVFWEYPIKETIKDIVVTDDTIVITAQLGNTYTYSLDKRTGKVLWRLDEHVISNIASNKSKLYFLTEDGYLKVLDINTGQEITKLEFFLASFEPDSPPSGHIIGAYNVWVDSQKDIVVVSFGDSCQLMALKLEPVE